MKDLPTIQLATARVLRDNPSLRSTNKREAVWQEVRKVLPGAPYERVARSCRYLQNTLGRFRPGYNDGRYEDEQECREYYGQ